ncbi:hypothetical protein E8E11_010179 [Didymella keratinophila]|nr:hypothetical protein E8E11_010179 [Didymella keratinophila]
MITNPSMPSLGNGTVAFAGILPLEASLRHSLVEAYLVEAYLVEAYLVEAYLVEAYLVEAYLVETYLVEA